MKFIKNKRGGAADKSQRELMGLILSLLVVAVVIALIFKFLTLFSPQEDSSAEALFLRIVDDIKYLEPDSSITEFLGGLPDTEFKDENGYWGFVIFPKDYSSSAALSCDYLSHVGLENVFLTRKEDVNINCERGKVCACLFFATEKKKEISFAKCNSISARLDSDKVSCILLNSLDKTYTIPIKSVYVNSSEDSFTININ